MSDAINGKKRLLFVDDEPRVLDALQRMLRAQRDVWDMTFVDRPEAALELLAGEDFDAVVSDVRMPGMSGLDLLCRIKESPRNRDVVVVMLTGDADSDLKRKALEGGATDLLGKPVERDDLLARLRNVLELKACQDELRAANRLLEQKVRERTQELFHSRLDIIWRLGKIAEHRDEDTGNHVVRVGFYSRLVAEALSTDREFQEAVFLAAPLHDIGKIGIPDRILMKHGPLSSSEWAVMRQHCYLGERILKEESPLREEFFSARGDDAPAAQAFQNPMLEIAALLALTHHERWDGNGYPEGLCGEDIPLVSRIVSICDVYDALTSTRPYRTAYPQDRAMEIINRGVATHFDPQVHAAFLKVLPQIAATGERFADARPLAVLSQETLDVQDLVCR
jgi:putative two-component system response regulator